MLVCTKCHKVIETSCGCNCQWLPSETNSAWPYEKELHAKIDVLTTELAEARDKLKRYEKLSVYGTDDCANWNEGHGCNYRITLYSRGLICDFCREDAKLRDDKNNEVNKGENK